MFLWCLLCYKRHISLLGAKLRKCVNFRTEILYLFSLNVLKCLKFNIYCCKKSAFMFQFHLGIILKFHRVFSTSEKTKNILNLNLSFSVQIIISFVITYLTFLLQPPKETLQLKIFTQIFHNYLFTYFLPEAYFCTNLVCNLNPRVAARILHSPARYIYRQLSRNIYYTLVLLLASKYLLYTKIRKYSWVRPA